MGMPRAVLLAESVLVLVALLPALSHAKAYGIIEAFPHTGVLNRCYVEEKKVFVRLGTTQLPGCARAICTKVSPFTTRLHYSKCSLKKPPPNCRRHRDLEKPFPVCCGFVHCPM